MLAFDGSTCLLPIRESMASKQEFKHLPSIVINTVLVISVLAALLCGKGYGPNQKEIVLLNISVLKPSKLGSNLEGPSDGSLRNLAADLLPAAAFPS